MARRWIRTPFRILERIGAQYLFFFASGVCGMIWPLPSLKQATLASFAVWFVLGSLAVGGALCSVGRWRSEPWPRIAGLSLIMVSLLSFILSLFPRLPQTAVSMFLFVGFMWYLLEDLLRARRSDDADVAVRNGTPTGSDLATYARDRLTRNRYRDSGSDNGAEDP